MHRRKKPPSFFDISILPIDGNRLGYEICEFFLKFVNRIFFLIKKIAVWCLKTKATKLLEIDLPLLLLTLFAVMAIIGFFFMVFLLICAHLYLATKNLTTCEFFLIKFNKIWIFLKKKGKIYPGKKSHISENGLKPKDRLLLLVWSKISKDSSKWTFPHWLRVGRFPTKTWTCRCREKERENRGFLLLYYEHFFALILFS